VHYRVKVSVNGGDEDCAQALLRFDGTPVKQVSNRELVVSIQASSLRDALERATNMMGAVASF
jgi:hypothetical protein